MFKRRQRKYSMSLFSRFIRKLLEDEFRSFKHSRRNASLYNSSASPSPIPNQINSKPEESEVTGKLLSDIKFLKKKTIENNLLLKELMNKFKTRPFSAPPVSTSIRTVPCPANTVEELNAICEMENLKGYLYTLRGSTLSKTVTAILKALMSRQLALKYSLSGLDFKRKHTKLKFQGSPACFIVEGVLSMLPEFAGESLSSVYRHIGITLKNAHDWEGKRRKRKKKNLMNSDMSFEGVNDGETIILDDSDTATKMMDNDESSAEVISELSKSVEDILDEEESMQPKDAAINPSDDQLSNFEIQIAMNMENDITIKDEIVNCDDLFKSTVDDSLEMYEEASVNISKEKFNIVFSCHICDKLFAIRDQLKNHMKVKHS